MSSYNVPALSFILCSRNDRYMGNSVWRLQTTLDFLAANVSAAGKESEVEIVVADWGSEIPLSDALVLTPDAAALTSFLWIPPAIASDLQGDSPFPEVLALNAAAKRAKGDFIGRIDQDTLVGTRFLETFFALREGRQKVAVPMEAALFFSNRRSIPYGISAQSPGLDDLHRLVRLAGGRMRIEKDYNLPFWSQAVGIWLLHRSLWWECGGYDERLRHHNWMETDMIVRLKEKYPIVNLGELVACDFYHLAHDNYYTRGQGRQSKRKRNPIVRHDAPREHLNPNGDTWGLSNVLFVPRRAAAQNGGARAQRHERATGLLRLGIVLGIGAARTVRDWLDGLSYPLQRALKAMK